MEGVIELNLKQMAAAYIFIFILLAIVKTRGISREREIIVSSIRMTLQLILTGYILVYLISNMHPLYTILVISIMETFAIHNIFKRIKMKLSKSQKE